jgi:hypothetical protein
MNFGFRFFFCCGEGLVARVNLTRRGAQLRVFFVGGVDWSGGRLGMFAEYVYVKLPALEDFAGVFGDDCHDEFGYLAVFHPSCA